MTDFPDRDDLQDILRDKVLGLKQKCPDVDSVHIWRWFRERWIYLCVDYLVSNPENRIMFKINSVNVWDNSRMVLEAFEFWDAIERSFLRKQRQFDRRVRKVQEKIQKINLENT